MSYNYTECNQSQSFLLPPNMAEWLPANHLAWFIIEVVDQMDLKDFDAAYRADGAGQKAHNPRLMIRLLIYAYCMGQTSSRKIQRLCIENVSYRILASNSAPDHCAIAHFRQRHSKAMKAVFIEVLRLCRETGLVKMGRVNLDGTKTNASLAANRKEKALAKEIADLLDKAEKQDKEENKLFGKNEQENQLPAELKQSKDRLFRLQQAKQRLEAERLQAENEQQQKLEERQESVYDEERI